MGSVVPWYDSLVSVITLTLYTVGVESIDSMDTTLVHLVVSGVCVTTHQTRVRWSIPIWTTCHLLAGPQPNHNQCEVW